jgi:uncharacterized membrane protein YdjX (TVP38/TMEM64 family)
LQDLEELIAASGYVGPVIFASSYAAATVLLFPASLLTLAAGYLFGRCGSQAAAWPNNILLLHDVSNLPLEQLH